MSIGLLFWILMIVGIVFSGWTLRAGGPSAWGGSLLMFVLLALLGISAFGWPIHA